MKKFSVAALAALLTLCGSAANAVPYLFTFDTAGSGSQFYNQVFTIDSQPVGVDDFGYGFTVHNVDTLAQNNIGPISVPAAYTSDYNFYTESAPGAGDGGVDDGSSYVSFYSDQLFTGTTADPSFKTGSFNLYDFPGGNLQGTLTISGAAPGAPAPELGLGLLPALAGAGALGMARTRRRRVPATA